MADEKYTFEQARVRLEEIVTQVRRKDVSLEASIELLEEGVRLANMCTELSDHTEWQSVVEEQNGALADGADFQVSRSDEAIDDAAEPASASAEPVDGPAAPSDSVSAASVEPTDSAVESESGETAAEAAPPDAAEQ